VSSRRKLRDMYGHRRILVGILALKLIGNVITASAGSFVTLLIGRAFGHHLIGRGLSARPARQAPS
jgi:predicted MFS family arabinose efflux permease